MVFGTGVCTSPLCVLVCVSECVWGVVGGVLSPRVNKKLFVWGGGAKQKRHI